MIEVGPGAAGPRVTEALQQGEESVVGLLHRELRGLRGGGERLHLGENVASGEFALRVQLWRHVALGADAEVGGRERGVLGGEYVGQLLRSPHVEGALCVLLAPRALAVGVLG